AIWWPQGRCAATGSTSWSWTAATPCGWTASGKRREPADDTESVRARAAAVGRWSVGGRAVARRATLPPRGRAVARPGPVRGRAVGLVGGPCTARAENRIDHT